MVLEVIITNMNDNECVNYRLILIKGCVRENNQNNGEMSFQIKCLCNDIASYWPVYKGDFKCLAYLKPGMNNIILEYKDICKIVNVNFKIHDTDLCLCPIYLIPHGHDGKFQAPEGTDNSVESAVARISLGVLLIQCIFGEKLKEHGFPRKSFQLENDLYPDSPISCLFYSKLSVEDAERMSSEELWESVAREVMLSNMGSDKKKFLCFISSTFWDGEKAVMDPALGGGGLALLGSASLHSWPTHLTEVVSSFTNLARLDPQLLDNSCYRGTYGGVLNTSLGSACHELGHVFNLGHTRSGLMSRGFDHTGLVFVASPSPSVEDKTERKVDLVPCLNVVEGPPRPRKTSQTPRPPPTLPPSDLTHLELGCAAILAHHPWFNPAPHQPCSIQYDQFRKVVQSDAGLRVVQVRDSSGTVLRSWELRGSGRHLLLSHIGRCSGATILAVDAKGGIFTAPL